MNCFDELFQSKRSELSSRLESGKDFDKKKVMEIFDEVFTKGNLDKKITDVDKIFTKALENLTISEKPKEVSDVVIYLDYGTKNHALSGDFGKTYKKFKDEYLKGNKWAKYNGNLKFGPGWVFNKEKLEDLESNLKDYGIKYTIDNGKKIEPKKIQKKVEETSDDEEDSSKKEELPKKEIPPKKDESKKEIPPPTKDVGQPSEQPLPLRVKVNEYGNKCEVSTGIIYESIPITENGKLKKKNIALGLQGKNGKRYQSLVPLDQDRIDMCKKRGYKYLTPEIFKDIENYDKIMAKDLEHLLKKEEPKKKEDSKKEKPKVSSSSKKSKEEEKEEESEYEDDGSEDGEEEEEEDEDEEEEEDEE